MNSPFPGMDPFLELHWQDVHSRFMVYASSQLNRQLPSDLTARVEESIAVEVDDNHYRTIYPDISVIENYQQTNGYEAQTSSVAVADPFEVPLANPEPPQRHLEIIDTRNGSRIVTAIELLSPTNKCSITGRRAYLRKQFQYIQGMVNLVEIDLVRSGEFVLAMPESYWPTRHEAPYKVCIRRVDRPSIAAGIGIQWDERLPNIPIPLRPGERNAVLELQPILDDCYRDGRYHTINYREAIQPPLIPEQVSWLETQLK